MKKTRAPRLDEIGYWSEIKLEIIQRYATEYSKILAAQRAIRRHIYIDAFAGAGKHFSKKSGVVVPGSPAIALAIKPPFSEYHFIDLDSSRAAGLREEYADRKDVFVYEGDCNSILVETVFPRCRYEDFARGLCILDPYGLSVDWKVLEAAGHMRSVEIFYSFMIMDANMNVLWRNPDKVTAAQRNRMDRVWGDRSWRDAAYVKTRDLFGETEEKAGNQAVVEAFQKRIREVAGFRFVSEALPMRNSQGAVVYYLIFASPNETGGKIVKAIFNLFRNKEGR